MLHCETESNSGNLYTVWDATTLPSFALIIAGKRLRVTAFRADCSPIIQELTLFLFLFTVAAEGSHRRFGWADRVQLGHHPPKNGTRRAAARSK